MFGRPYHGRGRGFGFGRGRMANLGRGNPYPFCRFNPELPSRRAIWSGRVREGTLASGMETEYLKAAASDLKEELDRIESRLHQIEGQED